MKFALPKLGLGLDNQQRHQLKLMLAFTFVFALMSALSQAATTGTEWQAMADMVIGWIEGYLGIFLAVASFSIVIVIGISKGTAMPALVGIAVAICCVMGPSIIQGMFTAVI